MKRFTVIGVGNFGYYAARALFEDGNEVVAIDSDRDHVQNIRDHCTEALMLDATDKDKLKGLGLESMDGVIVSTGYQMGPSILICLHLAEMGVRQIIVKSIDADHAKVLRKVGATEIVHPEKDMALRLAQGLSRPNILDFIPLEQDYTIVQVGPPRAFIGKTLKDLELRRRYNVNVIAIKELVPENFILVPAADFVIKDSDILMMIGRDADIRSIKDLK